MRSIQRALLLRILGALCLGAASIVLVTYLVALDELNELYDADLKNVAESLGTHHRGGSGPGEPGPLRWPARTDVPDAAEIVTITWTADGRRVFASDPRVAVPFAGQEALRHVTVGQEEWIVYTDVSANGVAQAAQRSAGRHRTAAEAAAKIALPLLGLVLGVALLVVAALRRGLAPLDAAARDVASRSASALTPIASTDIPREIAPLVAAINGLIGRLAQALTAQRRFLADAAHELRTPATATRLQLQLLQRATSPAAQAAAMAELEAGIDRSQRLIEQLLNVARLGPDGPALRHDAVELGALVRAVVASHSARADQLGIDLGAAAAGTPLVVAGDATQLSVLLDNLVENALRYTPQGGVVDVDACMVDGHPTLRVVDNGPGIAPAERALVFARFYRSQGAPQQARDAGGAGLGLAIVQAIAERHQARASLHTPAAGQGLEVRVVFAPATG